MNHPRRPYDLRVEGQVQPTAIAAARPRLAWRLPSTGVPSELRLVAGSEPGASDLWVPAELDPAVPWVDWGGPALRSATVVHWAVAQATADGWEWSEPASFGLAPEMLSGDWVTGPGWDAAGPLPAALPVLRQDFELPARVHELRLFLATPGVADVSLNGRSVWRGLLAPGYSNLSKAVGAAGWDLHYSSRPGSNRLEVSLGTGIGVVEKLEDRYTKYADDVLRPRASFELHAKTSEGWFVAARSGVETLAALGPTAVAHWYGGEDFDARRSAELASDAAWSTAVQLGPSGLHDIWWPEYPPISVIEAFPAVDVARLGDGTRVVDVGTNIAGWPHLDLQHAEEGDEIVIKPAELVGANGRVDQWSTGSPIFDRYTSVAGEQSFEPRLVYHGFRYLEVSGLRPEESDAAVSGLVLRASCQPSGKFTTSDGLIGRLDAMIDRAVQGNMYSVFTDCPHREKLGWIEQVHFNHGVIARNYDVEAILRDTLTHIARGQLPNGSIPSTVPELVDFTGNEFRGDTNAFREDPNWGGCVALIAWDHYRSYEDARVLERFWPTITHYLEFLDSKAVDGLIDFGLGDWVALDHSTPRALVATYGWIRILEATVRIAEVLGEPTAPYRERIDRARAGLTRLFGAEVGPGWGSGSQGSIALGLDLDLGESPRGIEALLDAITAARDQFTVGEVGLPALLRALRGAGHHDRIYRLVTNPDGPGYAHQLATGATALAETWTALGGEEGEGSQNHFMLGMIADWLYEDLAGLAQAPGSTGWRELLLRPVMTTPVDAAGSVYETPRGRARIDWRRDGKTFEVEALVPVGTSATLVLPCEAPIVHQGATAPLRPGEWSVEPGPLRITGELS